MHFSAQGKPYLVIRIIMQCFFPQGKVPFHTRCIYWAYSTAWAYRRLHWCASAPKQALKPKTVEYVQHKLLLGAVHKFRHAWRGLFSIRIYHPPPPPSSRSRHARIFFDLPPPPPPPPFRDVFASRYLKQGFWASWHCLSMQAYTIHHLFIGPVINCSSSSIKTPSYGFEHSKNCKFQVLLRKKSPIFLRSRLLRSWLPFIFFGRKSLWKVAIRERVRLVYFVFWCLRVYGANFIFSCKRIRWQRCSRGSAPRPRLVEIDELTVEMWTPDPCDLWGHGASSVMINSREHAKRVQTDCSSYDDKRPCFCARAQTGPIPMLADWQAEGHKALWQSWTDQPVLCLSLLR